MDYIYAKQILNSNKNLDWFGTEYTVNLYRGCCHGCIYCDSRSSCYQDDRFDIVKPKKMRLKFFKKKWRQSEKKE